jgi:hypothetical protein
LASGELKVNKLPAWLPMNVFNLKEKTMMNWLSCATIEMTFVGITPGMEFNIKVHSASKSTQLLAWSSILKFIIGQQKHTTPGMEFNIKVQYSAHNSIFSTQLNINIELHARSCVLLMTL